MSTPGLGRHAARSDRPDPTPAAPAPTAPAPTAPSLPTAPVVPQAAAPVEPKCPRCRTVLDVRVRRADADDFCRTPRGAGTCDYPLFWLEGRVESAAVATHELARGRLPGAGGRAVVGSILCPWDGCQAENEPGAEVCHRCERAMVVPPPPAPSPPVVTSEPVVEEEPDPVEPTPWWIWAGAFVTVLLAIAVLVYLIAQR